jgi:glycosyltransferase involved in cell wall biosynthesis
MRARLQLLDHDGPVTASDLPDADVVIATWWETAFMVATLPPEKGRKVYFVQHHEVFEHLPTHVSAGSYHLPLRKITISGWLRDIMAARYGDHDVAVVPNSVDTDLFHAKPRGKQSLPTLGMIYARERFKGLDVALGTIGEVLRTHPNLQVVAFGTVPVGMDLPLPLGARYVHAPAQDQLRGLYAGCDVFLSASRAEGFGLPILEAMACRTPVVATATGCATDVIENGVEGHVAEVEDCAGLAEGVRNVIDLAESDWRRMSEAAFGRATGYSWDDATDLFERALRDG